LKLNKKRNFLKNQYTQEFLSSMKVKLCFANKQIHD